MGDGGTVVAMRTVACHKPLQADCELLAQILALEKLPLVESLRLSRNEKPARKSSR